MKVSGQAPFISMVFSCFCCCHSAEKSPFCLYQKDKFSETKVNFKQALNRWKRVLKLPNLHMLIKQESITSHKHDSPDFWRIANSVLNKGKSVIPPLFNGPEVLYSASDKAKLFAEDFCKNSYLDVQEPLYLFSLLELI